MQRLIRTSYRNPQSGEELDGATGRRESLFDHEQHVQPWGRGHGALHVSGVATGLEVRATADGAGLQVGPGVALTTRGDHIVLAEGGRATLGTAVLPVGSDGVVLPTAGLGQDGERALTVAFAETFDRDTFVTTQGRQLQIDHTPAFALRPAAQVNSLDEVVLGQVTVAAGRVTDVQPGARTPGTARLVLRGAVRTPETGVEDVAAGELRVLAAGGLELESGTARLTLTSRQTVLASGSTRVSLSGGVGFAADTARMNLSATGASVGRDGAAPALRVDVHSGDVRITGALEVRARVQAATVAADRLEVGGGQSSTGLTVSGRVGIGTSEPQAALHLEGGVLVKAGFVPNAGIRFTPLKVNDSAFIHYEARTGPETRTLALGVLGGSEERIVLRINGTDRITLQGGGVVGDVLGGGRVTVTGTLAVSGTLIKPAGQFRIDHPLDPARRYLSHSFVESNEMKNVYDGTVVLDADGAAEIVVPDWFEALNERFRYQLTPLGQPAPGLHVAHQLSGNRFTIAGGPPGAEVCWQVTGVRHDTYAQEHPLVVESDKEPEKVTPWSG